MICMKERHRDSNNNSILFKEQLEHVKRSQPKKKMYTFSTATETYTFALVLDMNETGARINKTQI